MRVTAIRVEQTRSARARCRGCGAVLPQNGVRLSVAAHLPETGQATLLYHPSCFQLDPAVVTSYAAPLEPAAWPGAVQLGPALLTQLKERMELFARRTQARRAAEAAAQRAERAELAKRMDAAAQQLRAAQASVGREVIVLDDEQPAVSRDVMSLLPEPLLAAGSRAETKAAARWAQGALGAGCDSEQVRRMLLLPLRFARR